MNLAVPKDFFFVLLRVRAVGRAEDNLSSRFYSAVPPSSRSFGCFFLYSHSFSPGLTNFSFQVINLILVIPRGYQPSYIPRCSAGEKAGKEHPRKYWDRIVNMFLKHLP